MITRLLAAAALLFAYTASARADLDVLDGNGDPQVIFNFTCFTTKLCNATSIINSAGTEIFTSANPGVVELDSSSPGIITVGTAGMASSQVLSVQGIASMTPLLTTTTLAAGSAIAGNFRIDQTTLGTTNGVTLMSAAVGGCTMGKVLSAASTNATSIKGSAGTLCSITAINTTATKYYLKLYNVASGPTCNSDTVIGSFPVPASTDGNGYTINLGPYGIAFGTGIGMCLTGAVADNDNTNAATGVAITYAYK